MIKTNPNEDLMKKYERKSGRMIISLIIFLICNIENYHIISTFAKVCRNTNPKKGECIKGGRSYPIVG